LWILVNGEIVQSAGSFLPADERGRLQITASLPEGFVGVMRTGAAVRGFFTDTEGGVHTFLTSIHDWIPYKDRPSSAQAVLQAPSLVAPCQRRRGERTRSSDIPARLIVTIRGEREVVHGRLVDVSPSGLGVRVVRSNRNWFAEGTRVEVEVDLPEHAEPVSVAATISRVGREALHFLHGLRVDAGSTGRRALSEILDHLD
jgi:hypothetical protein